MTKLVELFTQGKQSPWLDNLRRSWFSTDELQTYVANGVRGVTSNPSIFAKSMLETSDYDAQFDELIEQGLSPKEAYWELVISDIQSAAAVLAELFEDSNGVDGYVSVEVSPELAHDADGTIEAARTILDRVGAPNVMMKVPATDAGLVAIEQLTAEERCVNVTLIFTVERYLEVLDAYLKGLERCQSADLDHIYSVASFFVSRTDAKVDSALQDLGNTDLQGKAAIAQAKVAYSALSDSIAGPRFKPLAERGANPQRLLWASTSTKNPDYPDTMYVDGLIGPHTVNTLPDATLAAFADHGTVAETVATELDASQNALAEITALGIDLEVVGKDLETAGLAGFAASFTEVLDVLQNKANA